jgi:hypothetical protein
MEILVPFAPETRATRHPPDQDYHCACWYQREFECHPGDDRVILRFGAIDFAAQVWSTTSLR